MPDKRINRKLTHYPSLLDLSEPSYPAHFTLVYSLSAVHALAYNSKLSKT